MKILGLDLGTNSIGWAVVDSEKQSIINAGVRIFPEGVEPTTIGKGDKEKSKNATRRDNRQMRRQFYRKRLRKVKLLKVLIEQQMCPLTYGALSKWKNWDKNKKSDGRKFPDSSEFVAWLKLNPYELRSKALTDKLTLYELGRIFYHLIQRRGFLSNRKGKEDTTIFTKGKPDENILPINETRDKIGQDTLGKYLYGVSYKEGVPYKTVIDENGNEVRVRGRYTVRDMYIDEFERIWQVQSRFFDLDNRKVKSSKTRELKGGLTRKKNKTRIEYLQNKYGSENVVIAATKNNHMTKVITTNTVPLKEFLGGKIEYIIEKSGEKKLQFKSNESVLFWQRPLRSQKTLLSNCRFEDSLPVIKENGEFLLKNGEIQTRSKKPCPLSHPEFELFRAYQFINNIVYGKNHKLTNSQREQILDLINKNDRNFDFGKIPEMLNLTYEKFNFGDKQKVAGNPTIKALKPLFENEVWKEHYEDIWHCFYFYDNDEMLFQKLKRDYGIKKGLAAVKKIKLNEGYGNVSLKAIRNILPFLKKGYQYDKAVVLGGVRNAFGKDRWEYFSQYHDEIEGNIISILNERNKEGEAIEKIKDYLSTPANFFGFSGNDSHFQHLYHHSLNVTQKDELVGEVPKVENLRNPIVQQGLYETRRLVNMLMRKYRKEFGKDFHFDQIKVEMGRDLKNNKSRRKEMSFQINENEKKNDKARERLAEYGLRPGRDNIQKYLMYQEIEDHAGKAQCPYTGKVISVSDLLGKDNLVQIEHIVPLSVSLDDSFGNKTLCEANFNREKGELTPYQFYSKNPSKELWGVSSWPEVVERAFRILPYKKAKRFTSKHEFEKSDFIHRQLNDSRYIAKKAVELLSHVCGDVRVMPGQLTAELRHLWGLNNILQPVQNINDYDFDVDAETGVAYYLIVNSRGKIVRAIRKQNIRPKTNPDEILVTGYVNKRKFTSKYFQVNMEVPEKLPDGKYWAKINVSKPFQIVHKFFSKPESDSKHIIFKGKIENGFFKNDTYGRLRTGEADGSYWAKFEVLHVKFENPEKNKRPKARKNQVMLFGDVLNGKFKCYIYQCETDLSDGKYWALLDLNPENVQFIRSVNPTPKISNNQFVLSATINEGGVLSSDVDKEYKFHTDKIPGKYYLILEVLSKEPRLFPIENEVPKLEKDQKLIEGTIWVDKYTGEIKFDPKKNRNDHRHHAIDAITIALTEQSYLQRLSTYNAQRKEKQRQKLDSTEKFPEPWEGFVDDVKVTAEKILISHKKTNKTLTKNKKGFSVRGQLHKENVFGKPKNPSHLEGYHIKKPLNSLKDKKQINKIVDKTIRQLVLNHLRDNCGVDISQDNFTVQKDDFFKDGKPRLFLPNYKSGDPVPIKKVRIRELVSNAERLKSGVNQYVNPRNNHHIIVFEKEDSVLDKDVVSFWQVVKRRLKGEPVYQLPPEGRNIVCTFETNDMFLLGISREDYALHQSDLKYLSQFLYRVQKIAGGSYFFEICFRYHTDSRKDQEAKYDYKYIKNFGNGNTGWLTNKPIKVKIDILGNIQELNRINN